MGRTRTLALAACIVAALGATSAARAAQPPNLVETSVDSGWSRFDGEIAAKYDVKLKAPSSATVTDRFGNPVPGLSSFSGIALRFNPTTPLQGENGPFTITFTATSDVPFPGTSTTTHPFSVDPNLPPAPVLTRPRATVTTPQHVREASRGAVDVSIVTPASKTLLVEGSAKDQIGPAPTFSEAETSGIQRVEIRFFDPVRSLGEVVNERITLTQQTCYLRCPTTMYFDAEASLDPGVWTMRVFSYDLAGSLSGSSQPLTFVVPVV